MDPIIRTCSLAVGLAALIPLASPAMATPHDMAVYMAARVADADGDPARAAPGYAAALAASPDDADTALRAYRVALDIGDDALVDRSIAALVRADRLPADARLLILARARTPAAVDAAIAGLAGSQLALFVPSLRAWAIFDRGGDPFAALAVPADDAVARRLAQENRALLLIATGQTDAGIAALHLDGKTDRAPADVRFAAAELLIGRGERAAARTLLTGDSPAAAAIRAGRGRGATPGLAFGASRMFARIAADLAAASPGPFPIALTRAALRADPSNDRARLLLANTLARDGHPDTALGVLAGVPADSAQAGAAAAGRVQILSGAGRRDAAIAAARTLAAGPGAGMTDALRLPDLLLEADRAAEAAPLYRAAIDRVGADATWAMWLQYGAALDSAGRWPEARTALERAVALAPDEPAALNYLGYARIEHGEALAASQAMLERAARLEPGDPAIADSLAWAYVARGQVARAVPLLERAVAAAPGNAVIGEHLGDAYWRLGRRYEARYAWRAAALVGDATEAARLGARIDGGLPR